MNKEPQVGVVREHRPEEALGFVLHIADAVIVEVEAGVVRPVVAPAITSERVERQPSPAVRRGGLFILDECVAGKHIVMGVRCCQQTDLVERDHVRFEQAG